MRNRTLMTSVGLTIAFLSAETEADTYFVDVDQGSDTNNGIAITSAWAHVPGTVGIRGSGWATIVHGDTIWVKGGTTNNLQIKFSPDYYNGNAQFDSIKVQSGHLANPQWGTTQAIIDGQNTRTYGVWFSGNLARGTLNGLTFDGFEVRNIAAGAAGTGFDDANGSSCVLVGGVYKTLYFTVRQCWLHDAYRNSDDRGHGIEFGGGTNSIVTQNIIGPNIGTKGCELSRAAFGVISNNFFNGTGDHCIALSDARNVDVCNNVIYNVPPQVHEPQYGIAIAGATCCDVWNNLIYRPANVLNSSGQDWSMGIGMYTTCISNRIVFNTVAYFGDYHNGNGSTAIRLGDVNASYPNKATIFQNNILYKNFNADGNLQFWTRKPSVRGEDVQYNCFFAVNGTENVMSSSDQSTEWFAPVSRFNLGPGHTYANNLQADPALTGGPLPNGLDSSYHPNSTYFKPTLARNLFILETHNSLFGDSSHGYSSDPGKFGTDIMGVERSGWSMGAYEVYVVHPPPPTGLRIIRIDSLP